MACTPLPPGVDGNEVWFTSWGENKIPDTGLAACLKSLGSMSYALGIK